MLATDTAFFHSVNAEEKKVLKQWHLVADVVSQVLHDEHDNRSVQTQRLFQLARNKKEPQLRSKILWKNLTQHLNETLP